MIITSRMAAGAMVFLLAAGLTIVDAPNADATICGSVGGRHVDVSGCSDPFAELNGVLAPPPPPPPPGEAPPPPPPVAWVPGSNVNVCANFGRRITVSGCV